MVRIVLLGVLLFGGASVAQAIQSNSAEQVERSTTFNGRCYKTTTGQCCPDSNGDYSHCY